MSDSRSRCLITLGVLFALSGCNHALTGQVNMVPADGYGDLSSAEFEELPKSPISITEGDTFSIRLSSVFVRRAKELTKSAEFLIYAEIFDLQPDDRQMLVKTLFNEKHQAAGYLVNRSDALVFGPIKFAGHPVRVRLFVVELDREENEVVSQLLKTAAQITSVAFPPAAPFTGIATSVGDLFLQLNVDDRELMYDFTLYPATHSYGPFLRTRHHAVIKTENRDRQFSFLGFAGEAKEDTSFQLVDEHGRKIEITPEDYATAFTYDEDSQSVPHPLNAVDLDGDGKGDLTRHAVLRVMQGELWLETVALEYRGQIIMANPRYREGLAPESFSDDRFQFSVEPRRVGGVDQEILIVRDAKSDDILGRVRLNQRTPYTEKTHAVITIDRGGKPVDRSVLQELSAIHQKTLADALQADLSAEQIAARFRDVESQIVKAVSSTRIVGEVSARFDGDDAGRSTPQFPLAYINQLRPVPAPLDRDDFAHRALVAQNAAVIEILNSIVIGFPFTPSDAEDANKVAQMKSLSESDFTATETGRFVYKGPGVAASPTQTALSATLSQSVVSIRPPGSATVTATLLKNGTLLPLGSGALLYQIKGSTAPASPNSPSATASGGSIDTAGNYTAPSKIDPSLPAVIQVFLKADLDQKSEIAVRLDGFLELKDVKIKKGVGNEADLSAERLNQADWLKRDGLEHQLEASLEPKNGVPVSGPYKALKWELLRENASAVGAFDGAKLTLVRADEATTVAIKVSSVADPRTFQVFRLWLTP